MLNKELVIPVIALLLSVLSAVNSWVRDDTIDSIQLGNTVEKVKIVEKRLEGYETHLNDYKKTVGYSIAHSRRMDKLSEDVRSLAVEARLLARDEQNLDTKLTSYVQKFEQTDVRVRQLEQNSVVTTQVLKDLTKAVNNLSEKTEQQTKFFHQVTLNDERIKRLENLK